MQAFTGILLFMCAHDDFRIFRHAATVKDENDCVCMYLQVSFLAFICGALMAWLFAFSGALLGTFSR
jgi:hypothetical protein